MCNANGTESWTTAIRDGFRRCVAMVATRADRRFKEGTGGHRHGQPLSLRVQQLADLLVAHVQLLPDGVDRLDLVVAGARADVVGHFVVVAAHVGVVAAGFVIESVVGVVDGSRFVNCARAASGDRQRLGPSGALGAVLVAMASSSTRASATPQCDASPDNLRWRQAFRASSLVMPLAD